MFTKKRGIVALTALFITEFTRGVFGLKKVCNTMSNVPQNTSSASRFCRFSNWYKPKNSFAWILRLKNLLLHKETAFESVSVDEIDREEKEIINCVQQNIFKEEIAKIRLKKFSRKKNSRLLKLSPFIS